MNKNQKILLQIDTRDYYGRCLIKGIVRYAKLHTNWNFYYERSYYIKHRTPKINYSGIEQRQADGIILRETNSLEKLLTPGTPAIICTEDISPNHKKLTENKPSIKTDDFHIGQMGASYFIEKGFSNFAFCGYKKVNWSEDRKNAFCQKISDAGYDVQNCMTTRSWSKDRFIEYLGKWLKEIPKPVALMACNDDLGLDVVDACKSANILVPEEVAVLGVDDDEIICDMCTPTLSSIVMGIEKAGYDAAVMLDQIITGEIEETAQKILSLPKFVVTRQSSDTMAINDPYVAEAVNYIRNSTRRMLQVDEVVRHLTISRRNLEMRFKKTMGRSLLFEIRRARTEDISQVLLETNLPIHKIASLFGFNEPVNISRFFKKYTRLSMYEYRKQHMIE